MDKLTVRDPYTLARFTRDVTELVSSDLDELELTSRIASQLERLLKEGANLPPELIEPRSDKYVMRPLYVAPDGSFSVAAAVWNVGQETPVHGHETWGVVGIYAGIEDETSYNKPQVPDQPLTVNGQHRWGAGEVTVCCTTDDDIHAVKCGGAQCCVGIHVYGTDIGTTPRRSYDPETGEVDWFVSSWGG